jgi:hypothetical protein
MSPYPFDRETSFLRDPINWAHDAFGHEGSLDAGVREACFRAMPHTGLDVSSLEPSFINGRDNRAAQMRTPVLAPVGGTIAEAGSDPEAGLFHLIAGDDGFAWGLGHHSSFERRSGRVELGDVIARMGMSGGARGVHCHVWKARTMTAARNVVTGFVNLRRGRTIAAWAESMGGLVDPYPHYLAATAAEDARLAKEEDMSFDWKDRYLLNLVAASQGRVEAAVVGQSDDLERLQAAIDGVQAALDDDPEKPAEPVA